MKNLFTIPMELKENEKLFFQQYQVKSISKETEKEIEKMNERIAVFQKKYKHTYSRISSLASFAFILFLFLGISQVNSENKTSMILFFALSALSLFVTITFMYLDIRSSKKLQSSDEYKALGEDGENTIKKAYEELGLVKDNNECDIYLHYYVEKNGKISSGLPYGAMMVKEYLISKDETHLILGDIFSVIKIPLSSIVDLTQNNGSYIFYGWNKKDLPNSEKYKEYKIKSMNNSMYFKAKTYYTLNLKLDEKEVAIFIAPYDAEKVKTLLNLS